MHKLTLLELGRRLEFILKTSSTVRIIEFTFYEHHEHHNS